MHAWEFFDDPMPEAQVWAGEVVAAMDELGVDRSRIGLDRMGTPGFLALTEAGCGFVDSAPVTQAAREVKTPEEIRLFRANAPIVMEQLRTVGVDDRPRGAGARDLRGDGADRARPAGSSTTPRTPCAQAPTRTRGGPKPRTARSSPATSSTSTPTRWAWAGRSTASLERSRVGPPSPAQRDTYRAAFDWLERMKALVRPGHHLRGARRRSPRCRPSGTCPSATSA